MVAHRLVALGFCLLTGMHGVFLGGAGDRPVPYAAVQGVGVILSAVGAYGAWRLRDRTGLALLAVSAWGLGAERALMMAVGYSRLAVPVNLAMTVGFAVAALALTFWAANPARSPGARADVARLGLAIAGLAFFVGMVNAVSGGRWSAIFGMALGTIGLALAAPNLEATPEHAAWRRAARPPAPATPASS